ncbi:MAG: MetQ/NlpA family ABC transporter substrate-binding protein [Bacillota bacterium]
MRSKKIIAMVLFCCLALAIITGCTGNKKSDQDYESLKLGVLSLEDILPMVAATEKGYFALEGLKVELIPFQSAVESQTAIQSGQIDGMMTDLIVAALLKDSGTDLKVTSVTLEATDTMRRFAIIVPRQSELETLADLVGKELGISFNSVIEYVSDGILKEAGVDPKEVEKVAIPKIPIRLEMLLNNKIAAANLPDPLAEFAELNGCRVIADDLGHNFSQAVLVMTDKTLTTKKSLLKKFYRVYTKTVQEINDAPQNYKELMISNISIPEPMIAQYRVPNFPPPKLPSLEEVTRVLEWLREKDMISDQITYETFVERELY